MTAEQIADLRKATENHRFTGAWIKLALDERETLLAALREIAADEQVHPGVRVYAHGVVVKAEST